MVDRGTIEGASHTEVNGRIFYQIPASLVEVYKKEQ
jgi:hypothetical protein